MISNLHIFGHLKAKLNVNINKEKGDKTTNSTYNNAHQTAA